MGAHRAVPAAGQGVARAARFLQQAARVQVDGAIAPLTLAALRQAEPRGLVTEYCTRRAVHYTKASPSSPASGSAGSAGSSTRRPGR